MEPALAIRTIAAAAAALLTGCPTSVAVQCKNGAICREGEKCTENPIDSGEPLCGPADLVEECTNEDDGAQKADWTGCKFVGQDGSCRAGLCEPCAPDRLGCWPLTDDGWHAMSFPFDRELTGLWVIARDDVYAVGEGGLLLHYDGTRWIVPHITSRTQFAIELVPAVEPTAVWGSAPDNLYVVGRSGAISRYDGMSWASISSGTTRALSSIHGASSTRVFAVSVSGQYARLEGTQWSCDSVHGLMVPGNCSTIRSGPVI